MVVTALFDPTDDLRHEGAAVEEWVFQCVAPDGSIGAVSGHRIVGDRLWYWAAVIRRGRPLLHVADWDVPRRADPYLVKGDGLWAEIGCDEPMSQWSVANETFASALDDPVEALGRGYGVPTPIAVDWEWYATAAVHPHGERGYEQPGVVHGLFEIAGEARVVHPEMTARRWHRWGDAVDVEPPGLPTERTVATAGWAPFAFPGATVVTWFVDAADLHWTTGR